jgi:hypothetical protein
MNVIKRLVFLGAIWFSYGFWNSFVVCCCADVPEEYLAQIKAARPTQLILAFESFDNFCADAIVAFDSEFAHIAISHANALGKALIDAPAKDIGNDHVQHKILFTSTYVFNIYFQNLPFRTAASDKALTDLHYTILYYYYSASFDKGDAFRPFRNRDGDILTPQEFAASKKRLSGKAYFRHWSKFLSAHRLPGGCLPCCCSIS